MVKLLDTDVVKNESDFQFTLMCSFGQDCCVCQHV